MFLRYDSPAIISFKIRRQNELENFEVPYYIAKKGSYIKVEGKALKLLDEALIVGYKKGEELMRVNFWEYQALPYFEFCRRQFQNAALYVLNENRDFLQHPGLYKAY